ncbi:MAG TPA: hypothetical protein VGF99_04280, partial [Myxococcota bacterium]
MTTSPAVLPKAVALATCAELPDLDADDHVLVAALKQRGVDVRLPVWDGQRAAFLPADGVALTVIRSTWDYTTRRDEFLRFVDDVERDGHIANPASVVRWNTDKRYLQQLAADTVPTVPTVFLDRGRARFVDVVKALPVATGYVLKPTIGAGSRDTIHLAGSVDVVAGEAQAFLDRVLPLEPVMVQPFLPGIAEGEVSLVYIDGRFSHAVNKRPKAGDFRSQPEFGSQVTRHVPTSTERAVADAAMRATGGRLLYARVDLVPGLDGAPVVIELE